MTLANVHSKFKNNKITPISTNIKYNWSRHWQFFSLFYCFRLPAKHAIEPKPEDEFFYIQWETVIQNKIQAKFLIAGKRTKTPTEIKSSSSFFICTHLIIINEGGRIKT